MLLEETNAMGRPVTLDTRAIETIEPGEPSQGSGPLTLVGLRSGRTLWIRSDHEAFRDRWRAALATAEGWREGVRAAVAEIHRSVADATRRGETVSGPTFAFLVTLASRLELLAEAGPEPG